MNGWRDGIGLGQSCWADFADLLNELSGDEFPSPERLTSLLPEGARNRSGKAIRFVAAEQNPALGYETRIYSTGEVSTRQKSWHDLFNALVWVCYPGLKSAMNALHHAGMEQASRGGRGTQRDALTLFDECGVIVTAPDANDLKVLSRRDWPRVFSGWGERYRVFVIGHAMLEKFLEPYKAMTANALLLRVPRPFFGLERAQQRAVLDAELARSLSDGSLFSTPGDLSPLPLAGIPGWWRGGPQDADFYADPAVFRAPPESLQSAPVFVLG